MKGLDVVRLILKIIVIIFCAVSAITSTHMFTTTIWIIAIVMWSINVGIDLAQLIDY